LIHGIVENITQSREGAKDLFLNNEVGDFKICANLRESADNPFWLLK
jgi:hypothetical protein